MSIEDQEHNIPIRGKENYIDETLKYFNERFADFHNVDLDSEHALLCGKPQAGKSAFSFAIASLLMLKGRSCVFVVRNYTQDASEMIAKFNRFSREHWEHMKQLGYETTAFEAVDASGMEVFSTNDKFLSLIVFDTIKLYTLPNATALFLSFNALTAITPLSIATA